MLKDAPSVKAFVTKQGTIRTYLIGQYMSGQAVVVASGVNTDRPTCLTVILGGSK